MAAAPRACMCANIRTIRFSACLQMERVKLRSIFQTRTWTKQQGYLTGNGIPCFPGKYQMFSAEPTHTNIVVRVVPFAYGILCACKLDVGGVKGDRRHLSPFSVSRNCASKPNILVNTYVHNCAGCVGVYIYMVCFDGRATKTQPHM